MKNMITYSYTNIVFKTLQEMVLMAYLLIVFNNSFLKILNFEISPSLNSILVYSAFSFSLLILLVLVRKKSKTYFDLLFFRLGLMTVLLTYMFIFSRVCLLCVRYHFTAIFFTLIILFLERFNKNSSLNKQIKTC